MRMGTTKVQGPLIVLLLAFGTLTLAFVTAEADSQQVTSLKSMVSGLQASMTSPTTKGAAVTGTQADIGDVVQEPRSQSRQIRAFEPGRKPGGYHRLDSD